MENIGCIHDLIKKVCEDKQIDYIYRKNYKTVLDALHENKSYNVRVQYEGEEYLWPVKQFVKGGILKYKLTKVNDQNSFVFIDFDDSLFDSIFAIRKRLFSEVCFGMTPIGKYRDCLSGGWYQMVDKFEYKGKEYANMECNC